MLEFARNPDRWRLGRLRPPGYDNLRLGGSLGDRLLPVLVAAMAFLAALALAGCVAAAALGRHWDAGAGAALTVQVTQPNAAAAFAPQAHPDPNAMTQTRAETVLAVLRATPGIASARVLGADELASLLRPWLGTTLAAMALPMPAVIDVRLAGPGPEMTALAARLDAVAPGTLTESHGNWARRLMVLAGSLQACAGTALLVVAGVAAAVVGVATRAAIAARHEAIEIVHGLGATDGYIADPFAWRAASLAALGGAAGTLAALPVLLWLADLAAPFGSVPDGGQSGFAGLEEAGLPALPGALWSALPLLPLAAALIGWLTAQHTVRRWLRLLP